MNVKSLREANERLYEDSERLQSKYNDFAEAKETELKNLTEKKDVEMKAFEESLKKQMAVKINRIKQTFGQSGSHALLKSLDINELPSCD